MRIFFKNVVVVIVAASNENKNPIALAQHHTGFPAAIDTYNYSIIIYSFYAFAFHTNAIDRPMCTFFSLFIILFNRFDRRIVLLNIFTV